MLDRDLERGCAAGAPSGQGSGEAEHKARAGWPRAARVVSAAARRLLSSRPLRWAFAAAAVAFGGYAVARQWPSVRAALASIGMPTVAVAMVSVLIAMVAAMQAWRLMLAALGSPLPFRIAARIFFVGQLGKYLPGSIWPMLAQMELGTTYGVPRQHSASASVLNMFVSLSSGLLTALLVLPFAANSTPYLWAVVAAPVLLVCLYPRVLNALLGRLFRLIKRPPLDRPLTARAVLGALAWWFGAWMCYGVQIWLLTTRLGAPRGTAALIALGGFSLAWCAGLVAVFVPAGAGVREVLLAALLSPILGAGAATAVVLLSRVLTTAGDLLAAATVSARPGWIPHSSGGQPAPAKSPGQHTGGQADSGRS